MSNINLDHFKYASVRLESGKPIIGSLYFQAHKHHLFRIRLAHESGPALEIYPPNTKEYIIDRKLLDAETDSLFNIHCGRDYDNFCKKVDAPNSRMTQEEVDKKDDEFEAIFNYLRTAVIQKHGTSLSQGEIPNSRGANDIYAEVVTSLLSHTSRGFPVSINDPASQKIITEQAPKINRALQKLMLHISSDLIKYGDGHSISSSGG